MLLVDSCMKANNFVSSLRTGKTALSVLLPKVVLWQRNPVPALSTAPTIQCAGQTLQSPFQRFLDLLHSSEIKRHTVDAYASELCISPKYLTAVCKKNSGKTANEWITEQVLEDIRYYLKQTDLSIKQICDRLGFPNPSFFGKYVKDHFGMTPMEFRNYTLKK